MSGASDVSLYDIEVRLTGMGGASEVPLRSGSLLESSQRFG